jgi:predicted MFS family arabinose efflux permease
VSVLGIRDRNIWLVYATIFLLGVAYGSSLSVTPLHLEAVHFSKREIGTLAAWFASGIALFSLPAGALVRRISAKYTLVGCLIAYSIAVAAFPFQLTYVGAGAVRAIDGASSVGVWVACETVLLARSDTKNKALVMSLYGMAIAIGYVVGSGVARVLAPHTSYRAVFLFASCLAIVALVLVAIGIDRSAAVPKEEGTRTDIKTGKLLWRIKTSCLATFSYGYFQASVVLFLPLYLVHDKSVRSEDTILMTALFAGGMLLFSSIAGKIGDAIGHLRTMTMLAVVGFTMILGFVFLSSWPLMCVAIFVAGASLASLSPVSLALQGHIADPRDYSRANALYNASYALGMLIGPPISSMIFEGPGGPAMLYHFAAMWACFIALTIVFRKDDPHSMQTSADPSLAIR